MKRVYILEFQLRLELILEACQQVFETRVDHVLRLIFLGELVLELSLGAPKLLLESLLKLVEFDPSLVFDGLDLLRGSVLGLANVVFKVCAHFFYSVLDLAHLFHDQVSLAIRHLTCRCRFVVDFVGVSGPQHADLLQN